MRDRCACTGLLPFEEHQGEDASFSQTNPDYDQSSITTTSRFKTSPHIEYAAHVCGSGCPGNAALVLIVQAPGSYLVRVPQPVDSRHSVRDTSPGSGRGTLWRDRFSDAHLLFLCHHQRCLTLVIAEPHNVTLRCHNYVPSVSFCRAPGIYRYQNDFCEYCFSIST